jgi:tetratricopeptide (TPR) repeat protein
MRLRYEVGRRLLQLGRYDEAIPALQDGQKDPKHYLRALSLLGQCFYKKEWYPDAIDIYLRAMESPDAAAGNVGKELQYYLGRAYEADGKTEKAAKAYSTVAQIDFLYKDVRERLDRLRKGEERDKAE